MISQLIEPVIGLILVAGFIHLCRRSSREDVRELLGQAFTLRSGRRLIGRNNVS